MFASSCDAFGCCCGQEHARRRIPAAHAVVVEDSEAVERLVRVVKVCEVVDDDHTVSGAHRRSDFLSSTHFTLHCPIPIILP